MTDEQLQAVLEAVLKLNTEAPSIPGSAVEHVLARLSSLPRHKPQLWRVPNVLLKWDFAPAWSRVAALACCATLGFVIGITGIDRHYDNLDLPFTVASSAQVDAGLFDPDSFVRSWP
jgi:hypothetical protein